MSPFHAPSCEPESYLMFKEQFKDLPEDKLTQIANELKFYQINTSLLKKLADVVLFPATPQTIRARHRVAKDILEFRGKTNDELSQIVNELKPYQTNTSFLKICVNAVLAPDARAIVKAKYELAKGILESRAQ